MMERVMNHPELLWRSLLALVSISLADLVAAQEAAQVVRAVQEYSAAMEETQPELKLQRFGIAEQLFRQATEASIAAGNHPSAQLYLNLGNAALQARHVGAAIVAWRRVLELQPGNAAALQNLSSARATLPESVRRNEPDELSDTLFFWTTFFSAAQLQLLTAGMFLAGAVLMAAGILKVNSVLRNSGLGLLALWVISLIPWVLQSVGTKQAEAVVTGGNCVLRSADSENAAARLSAPLPDGTEVIVVQERERWLEIEISGRTGWVLASQLEVLR